MRSELKIQKDVRIGLAVKKNSSGVSYGFDRINRLDVLDKEAKDKGGNPGSGQDLVKLMFNVISPGNGANKFLHFRANLTDFSDDYTGSWDKTKYIGRADEMLSYTGFSRKISISFQIAAMSKEEMKPLYRKMVYLASTTAPTYSNGGTFMMGTMVKATVGDYLAAVPGVIENVSFKWKTEYPWEINLGYGPNGETQEQVLPHILDCSLSFTPIHDFVPATGLTPFITKVKGLGDKKPAYMKEQGDFTVTDKQEYTDPTTYEQWTDPNRQKSFKPKSTLSTPTEPTTPTDNLPNGF